MMIGWTHKGMEMNKGRGKEVKGMKRDEGKEESNSAHHVVVVI
jgi:hypothetical protein